MDKENLKKELTKAKKEVLFWKELAQKNADLVGKLLNHQN